MGILISIHSALSGRRSVPGPGQGSADEPLDQDDFAQSVAASLDELPAEFLRALEHVPVIVADHGAERGVYGLYHGAGIARPDTPAQILIYRDTLTRDFGDDPDRLASEVRRTVRHELAHHLGYGESGVRALGL